MSQYQSGDGDPRRSPGVLATVTELDYSAEAPQRTPAGLLYIRVENVGAVPAQFNDATLDPGKDKIYPFIGKGYQPMPYSSNGSTLRLTFIL